MLVIAGRPVDAFYPVTAVVIWITVAVIIFRTDPSTLGGGTGTHRQDDPSSATENTA